jgi:hypothetical protein
MPLAPGGWISLDSLVRIETFQWVTRKQSRILFLGARGGLGGDATDAGGPDMRQGKNVHKPSLIWFLIFCNRLSS